MYMYVSIQLGLEAVKSHADSGGLTGEREPSNREDSKRFYCLRIYPPVIPIPELSCRPTDDDDIFPAIGSIKNLESTWQEDIDKELTDDIADRVS
ncbi:hypothetical protein TWF132_009720 [Orbilia oligospora]|nr:hypothetical protein TWF132_009720 [Orbilia oligospora]